MRYDLSVPLAGLSVAAGLLAAVFWFGRDVTTIPSGAQVVPAQRAPLTREGHTIPSQALEQGSGPLPPAAHKSTPIPSPSLPISAVDQALAYQPNEPLWLDMAQAFRTATVSGTKPLAELEHIQPLLRDEGLHSFKPSEWEVVEMENSAKEVVPVIRERRKSMQDERAHIFPDGEVQLIATVDAQ